jgi:hypothetical protein
MRSNALRILLVVTLGFVVRSQLLASDEDDVRQSFASLQKAIKARDAEKIWGLIDDDSQTDANRAAKAVQAAFGKTKDKADFAKRYGLTAAELADMNGKLFIKSNRFHGKYYEIPGSKIDTIVVKGNKARVNYTEDDGDKEKLSLVRIKSQWKVTLPMPTVID